MSKRVIVTAIIAFVLLIPAAHAESQFFKDFMRDYNTLNQDLLNHTGQVAEIKDFTYTKDVATFTFHEGIIHLLRYVDDRPTTAIFIGRGEARVEIPSHIERMSLWSTAGDSTVMTEFETCFIRFADDFDLALSEQFTFSPDELSWENYNIGAKKPKGEFFFQPRIAHTYDNYFELLRSHYDRGPDGFFWIDFGRYTFGFDPNMAEEVTVGYEKQGIDLSAYEVVHMQRQERGIYEDSLMSQIDYPTTPLMRTGTIEMSGLEGKNVAKADVTMKLAMNRAHSNFVSLFLDSNLTLDSLTVEGYKVDFKRRRDFRFIGAYIPNEYATLDTIDFTFHYHGNNFEFIMPFVENPAATFHDLTFYTPKGFNYFMPGMSEAEPQGKHWVFTCRPQQAYDRFKFECYASGVDTVTIMNEAGPKLNFLEWELMDKKYSNCVIPHGDYQGAISAAVAYMTKSLGPRLWTQEMTVSPWRYCNMPGLLGAPQIACVTEGEGEAFGGFNQVAGKAAGGQWFGEFMQRASDRERWITESAADYMNIMYLEDTLANVAYSNLLHRVDSLKMKQEQGDEAPLAIGNRVHRIERTNKGMWIFHMLRMLMKDLETGSDQRFRRFMNELSVYSGLKPISNHEFLKLAEKHCQQPLDWFARQWIYGFGYPHYTARYQPVERDGQWFVEGSLEIKGKGIKADFMPVVVVRVALENGESKYFRERMGNGSKISLGPFDSKPDEMVFNEFYSILATGKSKKTN